MMNLVRAAVVAGICGTAAGAQEVSLAEAGLQPRIDALAANPAAHGFELGMLRSLRAIEKTLQRRYEYGLGDRLMGLPMLRLELGARNPAAQPFTPETLSQMMRDVIADLEAARTDLAAAEAGQIAPFDLTLQDIWFDVNANGQRERGEDVMEALGPILLGRRAMRQMQQEGALAQPLSVRFDAADHAWLTAYTHMLSGFAHLFLAFDPAPILDDLNTRRAALATAPVIENVFDAQALRAEIAALQEEQAALQAQYEVLRKEVRALRDEARALRDQTPRDDDAIAALNTKRLQMQRAQMNPINAQIRAIRGEIQAARAKLGQSNRGGGANMIAAARNDVDAIYVLLAALRQQPDAAHVRAAHTHWLEMVAQNRVFWAALGQESDDDREWIPNPRQTSALGLQVDAELAQSWQAILEDAENLLLGNLLLAHPLLPEGMGISLKAYVEAPASLDVIDWIHGIGAYPFAATGPTMTRQRWLAFQRLTRGNAGGFALFFN